MKKLMILVVACILYSCSINKHHTKWEDNIHNPENSEFVSEVAFNLEISKDKVTQQQFNYRYVTMNGTKVPVESGQPDAGSTVHISNIVPTDPKK